ncbi:Eco57I restriction-modification methylase domain-containing protein [Hymenobacter lapidiphilus]|uniref:site-specific DNA-methyltransferase (adenine-specific) n=1 Tax=Hymenobacter lapidiphilus TaxID=2608003 RepID=A0A7Y7U5U1_9BACT|nr:TaqI-like C-terminal specificity domain-containing protein [Hymenobacter lapidiphilus]NVO31662.1 Eco57I restriction-modification methylase domain-containing protein [Hymenobacter lapidiphilus]
MLTTSKNPIAAALAAFAPTAINQPVNLFAAGINLFNTLGYDTSRQSPLPDNTAQGFISDYVTATDNFSQERARTKEWKRIELLFQLTQAEVINQVSLFDTRQVDRTRIETYLFWAIELSGDGYTRTDLAQMTRELNRLFPMPCLVLFRYGDCLTLAAINRRLNKKDEGRDVLEKVTLVKSINLEHPHPGHIAILQDLSFGELYQRHRFDSFVALHRAWQETLDIALLNKKFYRELYTWYEWAAHPESGVRFPRPASETAGLSGEELQKSEDAYRRLSLIRLLTRLIFVWFLREKKLVPADLFDAKNTLPDYLKKFNATDPNSSAFYQGILQNLFFATLNTPMKRDVEARMKKDPAAADELRRFLTVGDYNAYTDQTKYRGEELFNDSNAALGLFETVPFLNGGLFECLDTVDEGKEVRFDGFSSNPKKRATVPNVLFFGEKKGLDLVQAFGGDKKQRQVNALGLVRILEKYKFTIAENTPLEEEVALDPELLGKVFENLLATYNPETQTTARKQTGSFYTPREIVNYMVDESLKAYLAQALPPTIAPDDRLTQLFDDARPDTENPFGANSPDSVLLVDALSRCRILDPACGSGAFPMGILHRMVMLLRRLDPDNQRWRQTQLALAEAKLAEAKAEKDPEIRKNAVVAANQHMTVVLDSFQKDAEAAELTNTHLTEAQRRQNYARKLFLIENCIYGVDIQQIAVQIAKLRFFISLVAEQRVDDSQENRNILAMPNLETKFVAANTLIELEKGKGTFEHPLVKQRESELQNLRRELFFVRRFPDKKRLRVREKDKRQQLREALILSGFGEKAASQAADWSPLDVMHAAGYFDPETMFYINDGFDIVIGNPPYGAKLEKYYKSLYPETSYGGIESYKYFIDRGLRLTKISGILSYITSDSYLEKESFVDLRKFILKNSSSVKNHKLGLGIFENVGLPTSILFAVRHNKETAKLYVSDLSDLSIEVYMPLADSYLRRVEWKDSANFLFGSKSNLIDESGTRPLIELYDQVMGVKIYQVGKGLPKQTNHEIENDIFVSTKKQGANWLKFIDSGVKRYFLEQDVKFINYGKWLAEPRELRYFAPPKILIREVVNPRVYACYVEEPAVAKNTMAVIVEKDKKHSLKFLLALVNSSLFTFYILEKSPRGGNKLFPSITSGLIKKFPIKSVSEEEQIHFIRLVEYIIWLKEQEPNDLRTPFFEQVIDGMVYELYFPIAMQAAGCNVSKYLPLLPALHAEHALADKQLNNLYSIIEHKDHPLRKAIFFMKTVEEVVIVESKRK